MSLIRIIIFFVIFYILFKAIRAVIKYLTISKSKPEVNNFKNKYNSNFKEKYKDVEDAEYTEIDSEPNRRKE